MSRKVSQLGYTVLHNFYINLAIFKFIGPKYENLPNLSWFPLHFVKWKSVLAQVLKNKPLKVSVTLINMYECWLCCCFPLYFTSFWPSPLEVCLGKNWAKISRKFFHTHCSKLASAAVARCSIMRESPLPPQLIVFEHGGIFYCTNLAGTNCNKLTMGNIEDQSLR